MPRTMSLTRWQYALLIGTPIAIGAGYVYYRSRQSNNTIETDTESKSSVKDDAEDQVDPLSFAMTEKNKGNKYFKGGKYDEAIKCYTKAILLCPPTSTTELSTFYQNRAAAYENLKNFEQVVADTTQAYSINTKYTKALYRRAKAYEQLKDFINSLEDVTAVCILDGFQNQAALMMTDRVLKELGKIQAKEAIKNFVPFMPSNHFISNYFVSYHNDPFVHDTENNDDNLVGYFKAMKDFHNKQYSDVISDCTHEIVNDLPLKAKALLLRATFYLLQGQTEMARPDLETVLKEENIPKEVVSNALIKQASIKVQLEELEGCLSDFNQAIEIDPNNPDVYLHRGQIYLLMNKVESSVEDMKKAVEIAPDFAIAHVQLTYMKYRQSVIGGSTNCDSIFKDFEELQELFPHCSEAYFLFAQVLAEQQQFERALKFYDMAIKVDSSNPNIYIHKGILMLQWKQDVEEAIRLINVALEVDDKCEFGYETLGSIEVQRGNMDKAVNLFDKAIKLAKTENELVHLCSLKNAAMVQRKIADKLGINIPVLQ